MMPFGDIEKAATRGFVVKQSTRAGAILSSTAINIDMPKHVNELPVTTKR